MKRKTLALTLATCLLASALTGCGGSSDSGATDATASTTKAETTEKADTSSDATTASAVSLDSLPEAIDRGVTVTATPEMYSGIDLSKEYTVNMFLIGDTPNDWEKVLGLINDYLQPFNTQLDVTFMSWSDYQTMYSLVLAGGEQVDLIFTAPWCYMYTEAAKGSFYELTDDFLTKSMPLTMKYQAPESWDETTISGKTIAVPSNQAQSMGKIVAVRQDLMEKYGMTSLSNWDDYKQYMLTIAEKETPESGIYALAACGDNNELWDVYRQQTDTFLALDSNYLDMMYEYTGELPTKEDIKIAYEFDSFRQYAYDMKEMADAGCWSRGALTNTVTDDDAFGNLQGASIAWNASVFTYMKQAEKTEGVACTAYDLTTSNLVGAEAYSNNDMAIAAGSSNPERAAMVLDLIKCDTYLNSLICIGIEGEHYTVDADGYYSATDKATEYPNMTVSASWAIKNGNLQQAGTPEREKAIADAWDIRKTMNPTITFVFDDSNISAYTAAVNAVLNDYVPMLELGLAEDVDATLDEMIQKCYDAGLQTVYDEFFAQYDAWYATR